MNKYQTAIIKLATRLYSDNKAIAEDNLKQLEVLQELVDKYECKAPVQVTHVYGTIIECPTCHDPITSMAKYCKNCGQRIREDEKNG